MKFNKVEIQAFRAYQNIEDGTFDFTVSEKNDVADFVSIYAPNGFGKTSFYDAVEYGITNSIDRFLKSAIPKSVAKYERGLLNNSQGQLILRNKFVSDNKIKSKVSLYTTDSEKPRIRTVPLNSRKTSYDFHFDKNQVENEYFQTVILSQEWIDSFLKVDDPSKRYETFMKYFGDSETGEYYKDIINLVNHNDKKIEALATDLKGVQGKLNFEGDKLILSKVNDKIRDLNSQGEKLEEVDENFTDKDALDLANKISERLSELEIESAKNQEFIEFIDHVFSGNEEIEGVESYFDSREKLSDLNQKKKKLDEDLKKIKTREAYRVELESLEKELKQLTESKSRIQDLKKNFSDYLKIDTSIKDKEVRLLKRRDERLKLSELIQELTVNFSEDKNKLEELQKNKDSKEKELKELEKLSKQVDADSANLNYINKERESLNDTIKLLNAEIFSHRVRRKNYEFALRELDDDNLPSTFDDLFEEQKEAIVLIENLNAEIETKTEELSKLEKDIQDQSSFNNDLEEFISQGAKIADRTQDSHCPLCDYEYDAYETLAERISNNELLSKKLSSLIEARTAIQKELNDKVIQYGKEKEYLKKSIQKLVKDVVERSNEINEKLKKNKSRLEVIKKQKEEFESNISFLLKALKEKSFQEFKSESEESIKVLSSNIREISKIIETAKDKLGIAETELKNIESKIQILEESITEFKKDSLFTQTQAFFKALNEAVSAETIDRELNLLSESISKKQLSSERISSKIKTLDIGLKGLSQEIIDKDIDVLNKATSLMSKVIISFERAIKDTLKIDFSELTKSELIVQLEKIKADKMKVIDQSNKSISDFKLLKELKNNVEPYLEYKRAKEDEAHLKAELSFLRNRVKKTLNKEKESISSYLKEQISSFFYEELINDLYRRIDPHPDYKFIEFQCDFKDDRPKLNVCLYKDEKKNNEDLIIPNLYFSTAQLNILSLSIFLAKALNAKDDKGNSIDCIFIDDPIQSMDSINVLSTIDLFRGLVMNQKKQIILSTHDENFHSLLKKKIPEGLFKSKYIELETFGKVKR